MPGKPLKHLRDSDREGHRSAGAARHALAHGLFEAREVHDRDAEVRECSRAVC